MPLPSSFLPTKLPQFQAQLKDISHRRKLRGTGPFINGVSYGVQPTVKIYYLPAVIDWLLHPDRSRVIKAGAMIVKEQYSPPAAHQLGPPQK